MSRKEIQIRLTSLFHSFPVRNHLHELCRKFQKIPLTKNFLFTIIIYIFIVIY